MFSWFTNSRIRTKLNIMTGVFLAGLIFFALLSRDTIETVKINGAQYKDIVRGKDLVADVLPPPAYAIEAYLVVYQTLDAMERNDTEMLGKLAVRSKALRAEYEARQKFWLDALGESSIKAALTTGAYNPGINFFNIRDSQFATAVAAGEKEKARLILRTQLAPAYEEHRTAVDKVVALATEEAALQERMAETTLSTRATQFVLVGVGLLILCGLVGWAASRAILKPLGRLVDTIQRTANQKDLTLRLDASGHDEVSDAARSFNMLAGQLQGMMHEARKVAEVVSTSSHEVHSNAREISTGAQEQASCLEETAASLEEITATIKRNADNARQAAELAGSSRNVADRGATVVDSAVSAMRAIADSSTRIADIVGTIDEIAFQTNILALNAAVEAARAGDHGRGFAVVAFEVRTLAQRSADAAKEIKGLIADSTERVDAGAVHVNKSGEALREIVASIRRVTEMATEIANASNEQATGVQQVNKAVSQVDRVTQTNAARTEEMSATSESLAKQSENLRALVARFRLDEKESRGHASRVESSHHHDHSEVIAIGTSSYESLDATGTDDFAE